MFPVIIAIEILMAGALGALLARRWRSLARALGCGGAVLGCLVGLLGAVQILWSGQQVETLKLPWTVIPGASLVFSADALSAFFLLPLFGLGALAALYGGQYLWAYRDRKSMGRPWFSYNLLIVSIALVILSRNAVMFLVAWEVMSLASFFLVTFEDEREAVQRAGWTYLVATHLGTAALFVMFILLGQAAGSLDFAAFAGHGAALGSRAGLLFVLALVGFGTKAGIMPLHVWLPEAHPAAPSHVSAIMSGVMIKTGLYGIIRVIGWLSPAQPWWAWTLIGIGILSGLGGVLFALAQHDLKRLLAYSSVENIGIVFLGLGLGVLGQSLPHPALMILGYGAALLHILNHSIFKGLLFLGAGGVLHATTSAEMDQAGGLLRRMPWTGGFFLVGTVAICGLPPFNGFISEFLIYFGAFSALRTLHLWDALAVICLIGALALIGGLAAACFAKAFGTVFLGEPRSAAAASAHEPGLAMRGAMAVLALLCAAIGLLSPLFVHSLSDVLVVVTGLSPADLSFSRALHRALWSVSCVSGTGLVLCILVGTLASLRRSLLEQRQVGVAGTWDCGYARPTARMQYTASSFTQPLTDFFAALLRTRKRLVPPSGLFPRRASLMTRTPDACAECLFRPLFKGVEWTLSKLRRLQTGSIHLYILYIAVTLIVLLIWKLR